MRSLREQGLGTSALATVGAVTGFVSNGSLEEKDRESAAYSGGAGEVVPDIGAAGPKGLRCAIDNEMKVHKGGAKTRTGGGGVSRKAKSPAIELSRPAERAFLVGVVVLILLLPRLHTTEMWCRQTQRKALEGGWCGRSGRPAAYH